MLGVPPAGPPATADDLVKRAHKLAGHTLGELAEPAGFEVPEDLRRDKGWVGRLLETWLGTTAGNAPGPDFVKLGIELKTLPVDQFGKPLESTYVTMVPLTDVEDLDWNESPVRAKLRHVLWIPIHAESDIPIGWRMVGRGFLWRPTFEEEKQLAADWLSHMLAIQSGAIDAIRGSDGEWLQIRPKAAHSKVLTECTDGDGGTHLTLPRGFYIRRSFTAELLARHL